MSDNLMDGTPNVKVFEDKIFGKIQICENL